MSMIKKRIKRHIKTILKNATEKETWRIAIRENNGTPLYKKGSEPFRVLRDSMRYWMADPFLFEHLGKDYIFAELFDRFTGKGVIGVATIKNGRIGKFKVCLDLPYHLSYPCVFEKNGSIYMIPESRQGNGIYLYECLSFPMVWKQCKQISNLTGVDTTPIPMDLLSDGALLTTINDDCNHNNNLWLLSVNDGKTSQIYQEKKDARGAGLFIHDDFWMRPSQDDTDYYGQKLLINKVCATADGSISELTLLNIYPPDGNDDADVFKVSVKNASDKHKYFGLHTYNINKKYEVIDLVEHNNKSIKVWLSTVIRNGKR